MSYSVRFSALMPILIRFSTGPRLGRTASVDLSRSRSPVPHDLLAQPGQFYWPNQFTPDTKVDLGAEPPNHYSPAAFHQILIEQSRSLRESHKPARLATANM
jgi:hypothetical protein